MICPKYRTTSEAMKRPKTSNKRVDRKSISLSKAKSIKSPIRSNEISQTDSKKMNIFEIDNKIIQDSKNENHLSNSVSKKVSNNISKQENRYFCVSNAQ